MRSLNAQNVTSVNAFPRPALQQLRPHSIDVLNSPTLDRTDIVGAKIGIFLIITKIIGGKSDMRLDNRGTKSTEERAEG